jgi:hypothetical protein
MAANRGLENSVLAWVPVADLYILGSLVGEVDLFGQKIPRLGMWLPIATVGGLILSSIPFFGVLVIFALFVFWVAVIYSLFKMYTQEPVLFTVLSILFGFLFPIFLFVLRNNPLLAQEADLNAEQTAGPVPQPEPGPQPEPEPAAQQTEPVQEPEVQQEEIKVDL